MTRHSAIRLRLITPNGAPVIRTEMNEMKMTIRDVNNEPITSIKVLCEEFDNVYSYEVFIDRESYIKFTFNRTTKKYDFPEEVKDVV